MVCSKGACVFLHGQSAAATIPAIRASAHGTTKPIIPPVDNPLLSNFFIFLLYSSSSGFVIFAIVIFCINGPVLRVSLVLFKLMKVDIRFVLLKN